MVKRLDFYSYIFILFLIGGYIFTYFFGAHVPYLNLLQLEIKSALLSIFLISSITLPKKIRWYLLFIYVIYIILLSKEKFFDSLLLVLISPSGIEQVIFKVSNYITKVLRNFSHFTCSVISLIFVIILGYYPLQSSYFEGDEWVFFRMYTPLLQEKNWFLNSFLATFTTASKTLLHKTPLTNWFSLIEFKIFGLDFFWYFLVSVLIHFFVSTMLYIFFKKYTGKRTESLYIALIFTTLSTHFQAVTWMMAALHTQLAVGFGFYSLLFTLKNIESKTLKLSVLSSIFLLLSLWSKETAVIFIPLTIFLYWQSGSLYFLKSYLFLPFYLTILIFILTQGYTRQILHSSLPSQNIWVYSISDKIENLRINKLLFTYSIYFLKLPSQIIIPSQNILELGKWLTENQFPYFNQEKSIQGSNYTAFVLSPMPELLSYALSIIIIILIFIPLNKSFKKIIGFAIFYYLLSIVPLIANSIQFPWISQSAFVDSRHLYHISPIVIMLVVFSISAYIEKLNSSKRNKLIIFAIIIVSFVVFSISSLHSEIDKQQKAANFKERKLIITQLQKEINPPVKDLILLTKSNTQYYGFSDFLLPFQTPFKQMLPIIFSHEYMSNGLVYPSSFYSDEIFNLSSEGYYSKDGYGLGYFLKEESLIKFYESTNKDSSTLYAYQFDGKNKSFNNITSETRVKIQQQLDKREVFKTWNSFSYPIDGISFQLNPEWRIKTDPVNHIYSVFSKFGKQIFTITSIQNNKKESIVEILANELHKSSVILDNSYHSSTMEGYLDSKLPIFYLQDNKDEFYILSEHNNMYYKVSATDLSKTKLFLRTLEFITQESH